MKFIVSGSVFAALGSFLVRDGFSFVLTLGMRTIYDRFYRTNKKPGAIACIISVVSVTAGLLQLPVFYLVGDIFPFEEEILFRKSVGLGIFDYRTGLFVCWSLLYFGIRQTREGIERDLRLALTESENRNAQLQMLRAQMNPHFLFNALNTVLAATDRPRAQLKALVRALAEYLRYSLERVLIGQEFDAIASYVVVEKARFQEKLGNQTRLK